ncbi:hypothetical protein BJY01DRAFT_17372 [Aspergillus pseudoustus]|uniref:Secreted protein n=1 Tax=Aspergillus pseudoustus TaxID=1810923 RepID=A0ABR4JKI5_9EURO
MIYIARLCIAWLAASLKLRFMMDRRLGIQQNHISLLCLNFMFIAVVHPSCHDPYGWLNIFSAYSWYVAFQSAARKTWTRLLCSESMVYRDNICPVHSSCRESQSRIVEYPAARHHCLVFRM